MKKYEKKTRENMEYPLISIIVPIYKVESYLRQCLNSILVQTYRNLEIILVDDGSPDKCGEICDEYQKKDSRIKVIHKKNGGLSDARNAGLNIVTGEYIGFIDSDDWIAPDMYQYLLDGIKQYDSDIAVCEYFNVYNEKSVATYRTEDRYFAGNEAMKALLELKIGNYAWNKLYKVKLFEDIRYPVGMNYEDVRTTYRLVEKCKSVVALCQPKYYYRQNNFGIVYEPSISNKISCVQSRMDRYRVLGEQWPDLQSFLLKEIHRYSIELRHTICHSSSKEFYMQQQNLKPVVKFLRDYKDDIIRLVPMGFLWRLDLENMCRGKRINWIFCGCLAKIRVVKDYMKKKNHLKKWNIKKILYVDKMRNYYFNCIKKMPLEENSVLLESRGGQDFASNIYYIAKELQKKGMKIYLSVWKGDRKKVERLLEIGKLKEIRIVDKKSKEYYKIFATAKYLFNDMVYNDEILKRDGQIWVNVWHGSPLKCLEYDVKNQRHELGGAGREFLKTDYLVAPSEFMINKIIDASKIKNLLDSTTLLYSGYPRNQVFFDETMRRKIRDEMDLIEQEVFVYMPTWRGTFKDHKTVSGEFSLENILQFFDNSLSENQVLYVKLHNFSKKSVHFENYTHVKSFPDDYEPYEFLNVADCLITDYSSVFFDFANTKRKIILFTYDKEEYLRDRGLYIDLDELPFTKVCTYQEMREELNIIKKYDESDFLEQYCTYDCRDAAHKLVETIIEGKEVCRFEKIIGNGKKNILMYDACAEFRLSFPEPAIEFLQKTDMNKGNYFYGFRQWTLKKTPEYLENLPEEYGIYSLAFQPAYTIKDILYRKLLRKNSVEFIRREMNREMYGLPFDEIEILDHNKFDPFSEILSDFFSGCFHRDNSKQ